MSDSREPKKFDFERLGERIGGALVTAVGKVWQRGMNLSVVEMAELASRPPRHVCLLCGREPQDPYGAALGASCKANIKAAGVRTVDGITESAKQLTMSDIIAIAKAAEEAGLLSFGSKEATLPGKNAPKNAPRSTTPRARKR
jgi:hypothetical protein